MIAPKIVSPGPSRRSATRRSARAIGLGSGASAGFSFTETAITRMKPSTAIMPGITAAWNILRIEPSTMMA